MNAGLVVFSLFLLILGVASGYYPVAVLGGLLFIGALASPSKQRAPGPQQAPQPQPPRPQPIRRQVAHPSGQISMETPAAMPGTAPVPAASLPSSYYTSRPNIVNGALFPTPMIPSMNPIVPTPPLAGEKPVEEKPGGRDEVVELAAIVALVRLLSA